MLQWAKQLVCKNNTGLQTTGQSWHFFQLSNINVY